MNILLYIDGDNFSFNNYERLIKHIKNETPNANIMTKIFAEFTPNLINKWNKVSNKYGAIIHDIPKIKNKNVTDHFIIVAGMEDLYELPYDVFALASDDVDFISLFLAIKKKNKLIWQISQNNEKTKNMEDLIDKRIPILELDTGEIQYSESEIIEMVNKAFVSIAIDGVAKLGDIKIWLDKNIDDFSMDKTKFRKFSKLINSLNSFNLTTEESEVYISISTGS